jgi:KaiC/GvpD/RAD55 family RecA-like ATPase
VNTTPYLSRWGEAVVVIDPLTVLFQYADTQAVYRFLHVLLTRVRTNNGSVQVYVDPAVEADRTVELLKSLFDAVVEYETDAGDETAWNVHCRS